MAKVLENDTTIIYRPFWYKFKIVIIGAGLGLLWWVLSSIIRNYVIEPSACQNLDSASICINSLSVAGSIAVIIVAIAGAFTLVKILQPRAIVIAVGASALLWNLGSYLTGLIWWEALVWAILLFSASYLLFSLVVKLKSNLLIVIISILIIVISNIILAV